MYEAKLPIEAATMTRTALDSLFMLGAALYDPEIEGKLESQHMASGGALARCLLEDPTHFANLSPEERKTLKQRVETPKPKGGWKRIDAEDMAKQAENARLVLHVSPPL